MSAATAERLRVARDEARAALDEAQAALLSGIRVFGGPQGDDVAVYRQAHAAWCDAVTRAHEAREGAQ